ncbi:hypothetical protein SAMN05421823_102176 [Catalinimonas alkaloidigena]|uniref:HTH marR-type domain-containing protein n=1 Tax=Catalinimonas alkaloidigena TaxID=1075417 RepID=A0A1G9A660_9BACT|nr:MarR family transcriptional regulator [Catalinimonas alkaloidigena]SDK22085.1 hypothetical protein SAMN05421823_102176 [Catalinimonas alkaloidigena]
MTTTQEELIERVGIYFEKEAKLQPIAGRIMALLLVADQTELTFDEIQERLQISKGATSLALNLLMRMEMVEYVTKPGDRKRYFRNRLKQWREQMKQKHETMAKVKHLLKEILAIRPVETVEFNNKLAELIDFMEFMDREIPLLVQRWEKQRFG